MTVRELLQRTTSRELAEWIAFYVLEHEEDTQAAKVSRAAAEAAQRARRAATGKG